ncbi:MAG: twin-arginine translocase TatA/TatE family subunit [Planctomycetaceae bacterium]|nr:twin-arginine translocase TatA/TatE family subunit [Planctomycetaceae bacterium]
MGFGGLGPMELVIVGMIALLLFGKRLPEVARSLGKGIVEFKKGVRGIEDEVNSATRTQQPAYRPRPASDVQDVSAPKFEPPTSEPVAAASSDNGGARD